MTGTIFAIDVMPLLYRGYFAFLGNPRRTASGINTSPLFSLASTILQIVERNKPSHIAMVFDSSTPTFRHEAYAGYKAKRDKLPEDIAAAIPMAWEFAAAMRIRGVRADGFEADDLMGTIASEAVAQGLEAVLVTPDKDIAQLVREGVSLYRLSGKTPEIWGVSEVCRHWGLASPAQMADYLALAGDASDNIPGVPGIGEKTAVKLLSEYGDIDAVIAAARDGRISGKLGERLAASEEAARTSRFLTGIRQDVPLGFGLESLKLAEPDPVALAAFFAKYEFATMARRFGFGDAVRGGAAAAEVSERAGDGEAKGHLTRLSDVEHDYRLVDTAEELEALVRELSGAGVFAFDTEATSADSNTAELVGISFATKPGRAWYVPFTTHADDAAAAGHADAAGDGELDLFGASPLPAAGPDAGLFGEPVAAASGKRPGKAAPGPACIVAALAPVFASPIEKVAHNSKYDRRLLARHGMPVSMPCHDTMLMHFVLDAASRHGLDFLARSILGYDPIPISSLIGEGKDADPAKMAAIPPSEILDYAAEDADVALRLFQALGPKVREAGLGMALAESEEPLVDVLLDIEDAGVRIDAFALREFGSELAARIDGLKERIFNEAGTVFNLGSPRQLGEVLFERLKIDDKAKRTSSGQFATGEEILMKYAADVPVVRDILDWRAAEKLRSTYAEKLPTFVSRRDGRVHTHLSQSFTETGRLSSSDPNLQNIPVRTEMGKRIRAAFVARDEDHVLVSADYSQIELRIMAALSGDESMIEAFKSGRDIHRETAARVFGVAPGDVTPVQRARCKAINFGIIYGMSAFGLAQRLEIPRQEAAGFIEEYFRHYPGVRRYMDEAVAKARELGYATTILGRRRMLPDISSRNAATRQAAERNAVNTPVQGSAADLVKLAMVKVWRALGNEGLKSRMVLQIHDELLLDVPKVEEEDVRRILLREMTTAYDFGVPLLVEIGSGRTWLDAH